MFLPVALLLIAGLASDDFTTREACQEALSLCPELAEPVLWWHYPDPEVNHRLQVARQGYDPPWLPGKWKLTNEIGITCTVVIEPHGQARYWYASTPNLPNSCTWEYSNDTIILNCTEQLTEVYRINPGKRWTTAALPDEISCWWIRGKKKLNTRKSYIYILTP
jgi:hypothetical protein